MHSQIKPMHLSFWENGFTPHTLFPLRSQNHTWDEKQAFQDNDKH